MARQWELTGTDAQTGRPMVRRVDAATGEEAAALARYNGLNVSDVREVAGVPLDYATPGLAPCARPGPVQIIESEPGRRSRRRDSAASFLIVGFYVLGVVVLVGLSPVLGVLMFILAALWQILLRMRSN